MKESPYCQSLNGAFNQKEGEDSFELNRGIIECYTVFVVNLVS